MPVTPTNTSITRHLDFLTLRQAEMLEMLRRLVEIESPSDNKAAVDKCGKLLAREFERVGGKVKVHPARGYGNALLTRLPVLRWLPTSNVRRLSISSPNNSRRTGAREVLG